MARHAVFALAAIAILIAPAAGWARSITILRDPDIEYALKELARPMIGAAGLSASRIQILVLKDDRLNAFVADPYHVFINSGLILKLDTPEALQAVIAHELGHIANGHLTRRRVNRNVAGNTAALGILLSAIVAASGGAEAAGGILLGTASAAERAYLRHTRAEEASADQSGIRYMAAAGVNPQGMIDVLDIFRGQEALSSRRQDPYVLTHPLSRDRLRAVRGFVAAAQVRAARAEDAYWFARARGKLEAFIRNPAQVQRRIAKTDTSDIAQMRRAIVFHRRPDIDKAIATISTLVAAKPNDPFYAELQGQILLENRRFQPAIAAYARAARLAPKNALIQAGYGRALLAADTASSNRKALDVLRRAYASDPVSPRLLRDLGLAFARADQPGMAALVTAERYALIGRLQDAVPHAKRAEGLLARGSPGWNRAQDILSAARQAEN